jgi:hypothetical protein
MDNVHICDSYISIYLRQSDEMKKLLIVLKPF